MSGAAVTTTTAPTPPSTEPETVTVEIAWLKSLVNGLWLIQNQLESLDQVSGLLDDIGDLHWTPPADPYNLRIEAHGAWAELDTCREEIEAIADGMQAEIAETLADLAGLEVRV